jgi:hypothetical protein
MHQVPPVPDITSGNLLLRLLRQGIYNIEKSPITSHNKLYYMSNARVSVVKLLSDKD